MSRIWEKQTFLHIASFLLLSAVSALLISNGNVFAEAIVSNGVITDANDVRWEYEKIDDVDNVDEPQKITLKFFDKPSDAATIVVPTLNEVISLVPDASGDLFTYYLDDAKPSKQATDYPDITKRESSVDTTKLDMSNTSKIQILGVSPIINPNVETELVFGPNMVIGDKTGKKIRYDVCGRMDYRSSTDKYNCYDRESHIIPIPGFRSLTADELANYTPTPGVTGCLLYNTVNSATYDPNKCYIYSNPQLVNDTLGVFSSYKLKLTNFTADNFNYVGWEAFAYSEISGQEVTVSGTSLMGSNIFRGSNLKKVTIATETMGAGLLRDCKQLEEIVYADNVTRVVDDTFANTNLTSFNFSNTHIKTIGPRAFMGANLTAVDFTGIERIEYEAFMDNDLREIYLPKSINYLQAYIFKNNLNLEKVTVAYDTLTSGTTLQFYVVLDGEWGAGEYTSSKVKELNVIAPYAEGEEVSATHIPYEQYKWHYHAVTQEYMENPCGYGRYHDGCSSASTNDYGYTQYSAYNSDGSGPRAYGKSGSQFEVDYARVDEKKNIIAPAYFANLHGLKVINIGEGYEYIGSSAFTDWSDAGTHEGAGTYLIDVPDTGNRLTLPESLKGIGNLAFDHLFNNEIGDFTIPKNIEFIGIFAFKQVYAYTGDVDFPNLEALGDHAFEKTRVRNIHLYDKLVYMGAQVFSDCLFLNDITFDLDVFNPDIYIAWALPHRHAPEWYDGQFHFTTEFGPRYSYSFSQSDIDKYGIRVSEKRDIYNLWPLQFGTITFTEKNVSQLPNGYHNCYYFNERTSDAVKGCPGGYYGTGIYNTFFGHLNADKIDIGETNWKVLSPRMFVQTHIGEVVLPKNLEVIPGDSFSDSVIDEELILPDTIKVIGDAAFNFGQIYSYARNWSTGGVNEEYLSNHTIKITKLPESLEYLGNDAFWGDYGLTADLNSPNLWHVGYKVFWGTRLRDVYLPSTIKSMNAASFANISTLRNITIDFDLGALPPNYEEPFNPEDFPQSLRDYAGLNIYQLIHMSCSAKNMANSRDYPVTTFYSLFNQKIAYDEHDPNNYNIITAYGQKLSETHYGKVVFTDNNQTDIYMTGTGYFSGLQFDELDMSKAGWKHTVKNVPWGFEGTKIGKLKLPEGLETVTMGAFESAQIEEPFTWPSTLKTVGMVGFQWANGEVDNELPEGLETIGMAAFYASDLTDDLVIPSTVTSIGSSAFNAGDADVHYDTVTIRPDLTYNMDSGQLVHQLLWNNDIDKMIVDSEVLPALNKLEQTGEIGEYEQEFWGMPMDEVVLNNLRGITRQAFINNVNLEKVDASKNANLSHIDEEAFLNDEKLHIFEFSPELKNETVTIGKNAFKTTAFETMGDSSTDFDLTAANFDGSDGYAFSGMPKLRSVDIPANFSNQTIPRASFHNDPELTEATVAYQITDIKNAAFSNDDKLERIFIWGDTAVEDKNIGGYTMPTRAPDDTVGEGFGPTIPQGTDIYAYSSNLTESYAAYEGRDDYEGVFYPLDEVIYLTSNDPRVKFTDDGNDFDKSNLIVYGIRRDGIILESDNWAEFDGTAYPRSETNITFEKMAPTIEENPAFGTVYDTPVPLNMLSLANVNFENIGYEFIRDDSSDDSNVRLINLIYTDAYTGGEPDTDIDPYNDPSEGHGIFGPNTLDTIIRYVSVAGIAVAGVVAMLNRRNRR